MPRSVDGVLIRFCLLLVVGLLVVPHSAGSAGDGGLAAWGCGGVNDDGQCRMPLLAGQSVVAIAAGTAHTLALTKAGSVIAWGCGRGNDYGQCRVPASARQGVRAIAAGAFHSLALTRNGRVVAWGCGGLIDA